jgi:hypothetical protein
VDGEIYLRGQNTLFCIRQPSGFPPINGVVWTILRANIDRYSEVGPLTQPSQRTVEAILCAVLP